MNTFQSQKKAIQQLARQLAAQNNSSYQKMLNAATKKLNLGSKYDLFLQEGEKNLSPYEIVIPQHYYVQGDYVIVNQWDRINIFKKALVQINQMNVEVYRRFKTCRFPVVFDNSMKMTELKTEDYLSNDKMTSFIYFNEGKLFDGETQEPMNLVPYQNLHSFESHFYYHSDHKIKFTSAEQVIEFINVLQQYFVKLEYFSLSIGDNDNIIEFNKEYGALRISTKKNYIVEQGFSSTTIPLRKLKKEQTLSVLIHGTNVMREKCLSLSKKHNMKQEGQLWHVTRAEWADFEINAKFLGFTEFKIKKNERRSHDQINTIEQMKEISQYTRYLISLIELKQGRGEDAEEELEELKEIEKFINDEEQRIKST